MSVYMLLKNMRVQRANIMQTPFVASPAPVFAAVMLGHMLADRLGVRDLGVGIVHHAAEIDVESLPTKSDWLLPSAVLYRGATNESGAAPTGAPMIPAITATLHLSLIVRLDDHPGQERAQRIVGLARLAGGTVSAPPTVVFFESLQDAIQACGRGFWVSDATEMVRERLRNGTTVQEAVLAPVNKAGWYAPATLGYRRISSFARRGGARDGLEHAFAEAMLGLVQYQSIHRIESPHALWRHQWVGDRRAFIVSQH
jgi:CRISPR-associated protein Csy2